MHTSWNLVFLLAQDPSYILLPFLDVFIHPLDICMATMYCMGICVLFYSFGLHGSTCFPDKSSLSDGPLVSTML